jgi:hypothetical protein
MSLCSRASAAGSSWTKPASARHAAPFATPVPWRGSFRPRHQAADLRCPQSAGTAARQVVEPDRTIRTRTKLSIGARPPRTSGAIGASARARIARYQTRSPGGGDERRGGVSMSASHGARSRSRALVKRDPPFSAATCSPVSGPEADRVPAHPVAGWSTGRPTPCVGQQRALAVPGRAGRLIEALPRESAVATTSSTVLTRGGRECGRDAPACAGAGIPALPPR